MKTLVITNHYEKRTILFALKAQLKRLMEDKMYKDFKSLPTNLIISFNDEIARVRAIIKDIES